MPDRKEGSDVAKHPSTGRKLTRRWYYRVVIPKTSNMSGNLTDLDKWASDVVGLPQHGLIRTTSIELATKKLKKKYGEAVEFKFTRFNRLVTGEIVELP